MSDDTARSTQAPRYPMRAVTRRTGLSPDVLRVWERRYGVVRPERSEGGQRLYSEADIERLLLLHRATLAGHSIREVAGLDAAALRTLLRDAGELAPNGVSPAPPRSAEELDAALAEAMAAVERLDGAALEGTLKRAALARSSTWVLDRVMGPLLHRIGERWHDGTLSPAHEHLASATVRRVLAWIVDAYEPHEGAPRVVIATPAGETHELGAMLAAAAAAEEGWRTVYLGPDLPAANVAAAAAQVGARAVALSLIYPTPAARLVEEIRQLRGALPASVPLLLGGPAAERHEATLENLGARVLSSIPALRELLRELESEGALRRRGDGDAEQSGNRE